MGIDSNRHKLRFRTRATEAWVNFIEERRRGPFGTKIDRGSKPCAVVSCATEEKVFAVVAFRRLLTSSRAPPRRVSRASNMAKKRGANQHTGKPFIEWCAENGKRGERLANEFREELPTELTKGSNYKAKWKCLKCKHVWRAQVNNRTRSDKPAGCPKCAHNCAGEQDEQLPRVVREERRAREEAVARVRR